MLKTPTSRFASLLISCLLATTLLFSQSDTSQIVGYVRDASGGSVPNAKIVASNESTGVERQATTTADGYYILTNLPPHQPASGLLHRYGGDDRIQEIRQEVEQA